VKLQARRSADKENAWQEVQIKCSRQRNEKCQRANYKFWYKEQWAGKISFHAAKRGRGTIKLPELPEARGAMVLGQLATLSSSMQSEGRAKLANNIS